MSQPAASSTTRSRSPSDSCDQGTRWCSYGGTGGIAASQAVSFSVTGGCWYPSHPGGSSRAPAWPGLCEAAATATAAGSCPLPSYWQRLCPFHQTATTAWLLSPSLLSSVPGCVVERGLAPLSGCPGPGPTGPGRQGLGGVGFGQEERLHHQAMGARRGRTGTA